MQRITAILVGIIIVVGASTALAGEVQLRAESSEVFVDVPFLVAIDIAAEQSHEAPTFPEIDGATAELADTSQSTSSRFQITINGRQASQNRTTTRYLYRIVPKKEGALRLPAIGIVVDGETKHTQPVLFRVTKTDSTDLLFVELKTERDQVYVGEPVDLTLEVWLLPYSQPDYRMDANDMWGTIDRSASSWGPFHDAVMQRQPRVTFRSDQRIGADKRARSYIVFEVPQRIWAERPGPLLTDELSIVVKYPLRIGRSRSAFGMLSGLRVEQAQTIVGAVADSPVTVLPIPAQGRPPYYRGAVGRHTITATAAPTEARVGDPITLTLIVRGPGQLETLQAPPLADLAEFSQQFKVSDDPLPGVVANGQKRFTQSVRALSADVTEVPRIPFAYFDPQAREFVTVYTNPIPLKIEPAERMSAAQIVQSGTPADRSVDNLTHSVYGIEGNYVDAEALLAQHGLRPTPAVAAVVGGCPVIYAACALLLHRRRKLESDSALRRRRGARRRALRAIDRAAGRSDADTSDTDPSAGVPGALADALLGYIADRFDLPAGALTRQEAIARLEQAGAPTDLVQQVNDVLADCEAAQFGGGTAVALADLSSSVRNNMEALARAGF
jgi:hypothetical protein